MVCVGNCDILRLFVLVTDIPEAVFRVREVNMYTPDLKMIFILIFYKQKFKGQNCSKIVSINFAFLSEVLKKIYLPFHLAIML